MDDVDVLFLECQTGSSPCLWFFCMYFDDFVKSMSVWRTKFGYRFFFAKKMVQRSPKTRSFRETRALMKKANAVKRCRLRRKIKKAVDSFKGNVFDRKTVISATRVKKKAKVPVSSRTIQRKMNTLRLMPSRTYEKPRLTKKRIDTPKTRNK